MTRIPGKRGEVPFEKISRGPPKTFAACRWKVNPGGKKKGRLR